VSPVTTGRRLDEQGTPIAGTGFEVDSDGPIAAHLRQRESPLLSNPVTGEWVTTLEPREQTGAEYESGLGIFPAGNDGPPEHYHVGYEETFEIVTGTFEFTAGGETHTVSAGGELTIQPKVPHTFRNVGDELGATVTTTRPAASTGDVIATLYGLGHEGELDSDGQPAPLQGLVMAAETADDTVFTSPPPSIALPLAKVVAPLARRLGYSASRERSLSDEFWERHVEQPDL
jgi:mannose-6-phosphate isomerase-like protein (cupin superfamily)